VALKKHVFPLGPNRAPFSLPSALGALGLITTFFLNPQPTASIQICHTREDIRRGGNSEISGESAQQSSTDGNVVTLKTTVQIIMTALKTSETEDEIFTVVMKDVCGLAMRKQGPDFAV
jgi:hypothetical protein